VKEGEIFDDILPKDDYAKATQNAQKRRTQCRLAARRTGKLRGVEKSGPEFDRKSVGHSTLAV